MGQDRLQPLGITQQQIGAFVTGETPREPDGQRALFQHAGGLGYDVGRRIAFAVLAHHALATGGD